MLKVWERPEIQAGKSINDEAVKYLGQIVIYAEERKYILKQLKSFQEQEWQKQSFVLEGQPWKYKGLVWGFIKLETKEKVRSLQTRLDQVMH